MLLKDSQRVAFEAFTRCVKYLSVRDVVEEFVEARVWPLSEGWSTVGFGSKGPEGLCLPQLDIRGFTGMFT